MPTLRAQFSDGPAHSPGEDELPLKAIPDAMREMTGD